MIIELAWVSTNKEPRRSRCYHTYQTNLVGLKPAQVEDVFQAISQKEPFGNYKVESINYALTGISVTLSAVVFDCPKSAEYEVG